MDGIAKPHNGPHDMGGRPVVEPACSKIDLTPKPLQHWEYCIHALLVVLSTRSPPLLTTDELRRGVESLEEEAYHSWSYYEKWGASMSKLLLERAVITENELDNELFGSEYNASAADVTPFAEGTVVRVCKEDTRTRWRKPHLRCPGYIFGQTGRIVKYVGQFEDPYFLAFRGSGPPQHLYVVEFGLRDVWSAPEAPSAAAPDVVTLDIYHTWLTPVSAEDTDSSLDSSHAEHSHAEDAVATAIVGTSAEPPYDHQRVTPESSPVKRRRVGPEEHTHSQGQGQDHGHSHEHGHDHGHGHEHEGREVVEATALQREGAPTPGEEVAQALLRLLYKKGVVSEPEVRRSIEKLDMAGRTMAGADLVVKSWMDPEFKKRLLANAPAAALELGIITSNPNAPTILQVVENTPTLHNVIVCTLCSCYPIGLLGLSPPWYKSRSYRSRVVKEPRVVLKEFGTEIPSDVAVRVHDSTADCRFMVLPMRPSGTDTWSPEQLKALVTRDSMVGVTVLPPAAL